MDSHLRTHMLTNYIIIAWRHTRRQSLYSFINILGLALGMACSLVIFLYVYGEWSYDRHFANNDRIYRIGVSFFNMGNFAKGPEMLADVLPTSFGGIREFTRFNKSAAEYLDVDGEVFNDLVYHVDSSFFKVFSYEFIEGSPPTAMSRPHSVVLTESMAQKYFHTSRALGKTIAVGKEKVPHTITGIVKDEHRNSHLKAQVWTTLDLDPHKQYHWTSASTYNYVLLRENVSQTALADALESVIAEYVFPSAGRAMGKKSVEEYKADPNSVKFFIHPLKDIYLKSRLSLELSPGGSETNMIIFGIIAAFMLVLAGVNFINLSTARAARRAKEVGIRKTLGTTRPRLISQFLLESVMVCVFSMIIALGIAELFTFAFFWITGQQLSISLWANAWSIAGVLGFSVMVGLVAGVYPAFYLTAFQPVHVLKGTFHGYRRQSFRNGLVVFQFSISITLIICTIVIARQLSFMSNKDLGFVEENTLTIDNIDLVGNRFREFKNEVLQHPDVVNASLHTGEPGSKAIMTFYTFQTAEMPNALTINTYFGDEDYLDVMGFSLIAGRHFNENLASDTASVILNESAVRALGLAGDPIGAVLNENQTVIGVVRDFHWESLRNAIEPAVILIPNERRFRGPVYSQLAIKLKSTGASSLWQHLESRWKAFVPGEPMRYHFLDENFGELIKKEEVLGKAVGIFTGLAIAISCLGLFGLAAYTTEQRTKEIGIRKTLGASSANIVLMLNRQFTILVVIAMLVAVPISYYAAREWLAGFAYRVDLNVLIFLIGGIAGLVISFCTVAFHSLKAAQTNPSEILKCE